MDKAAAAPNRWPYTEHRTLEQVRLDNEAAERRANRRAKRRMYVRGAYKRRFG